MIKPNVLISVETDETMGEVITLKRSLRLLYRGKVLYVPKGFKSDGASVPRLFWRVVFPPLDNKSLKAAIFHDYIYRTDLGDWKRKEADRMFYYSLLWNGVPFTNATLAYLGVRLFGWASWRKKND